MLDPRLFHFTCMLFQGGFLFCMAPGAQSRHLRAKPLYYGHLWSPFIPLPPAEIFTFVKLYVAFLIIVSYLSSVHAATEMADLCVTDLSLALAHNLIST